MASLSDDLEYELLNHVFRTDTLVKIPNLYCALFTADPTDAGTGAEVSTSGTAYARVAVPVADASWTAPADMGGAMGITNLIDIQYLTPTADWGTPSHWGLMTAVIDGDLWLYGAIGGVLRTVDATDDPVSFAPGAITITIGQAASDYLEAGLLNHLLRTDEFAKPANIYASLHNEDPGDDATFAGEFTGTNYARVAIAVADSSWSVPFAAGTDMRITNVNPIQFPPPLSEWGTYTDMALSDALVLGNKLVAAPLVVPRTVNANDNPPVWLPGSLQVQIG